MVCSRIASSTNVYRYTLECWRPMRGSNRFASSVVAHNKRQGLVKLYHHLVVRAERPDPLDQHLHGSTDTFRASAPKMVMPVTSQTDLVDCAHLASMAARLGVSFTGSS